MNVEKSHLRVILLPLFLETNPKVNYDPTHTSFGNSIPAQHIYISHPLIVKHPSLYRQITDSSRLRSIDYRAISISSRHQAKDLVIYLQLPAVSLLLRVPMSVF